MDTSALAAVSISEAEQLTLEKASCTMEEHQEQLHNNLTMRTAARTHSAEEPLLFRDLASSPDGCCTTEQADDIWSPEQQQQQQQDDTFVSANLALMRELDALSASGERLRESVDRQREKLVKKLKDHLTSIKEGMNQAPYVKTRDKLTFVAGVVNVALMFFVLGRHPEWMRTYFTIKFAVLLSIRWYIFKGKKYHYFLFDFCYFANLLVIAYLHFFPNNETLFIVCFAFCTGPLAWSILAWRNSLVFHSLDKTTSLFIHLTPNLVLYGQRWLNHESERHYEELSSSISFTTMFLTPILPYLVWQVLYFIKVQIISAKKVEERDYQTTLRWFTRMDKGKIGKLIKKTSPNWRVAAFIGYQFLFTVVTMLPAILYLRYFWAHTCLMVSMCVLSAWNGASYYFEIFSTRYIQSLEQGAEKVARLRRGSLSLQATIQ